MLSITQYNLLLQHQYNDVENKARKITIFFSPSFFLKRFFVKRAVRKTTSFMSRTLIQMKGVLADVQDKAELLKGKDLSAVIRDVEKVLTAIIKLKESISESLDQIEDASRYFPDTISWSPILCESVDTLYATIRILKRLNQKTPIDTSSLARESSKRSLTSLERTAYDRRAT